MVQKENFLANFHKQLDFTPIENLSLNTRIQEIEEWDSLVGLSVIAMINDEYGVRLFQKDIERIETINDLLILVNSRINAT